MLGTLVSIIAEGITLVTTEHDPLVGKLEPARLSVAH